MLEKNIERREGLSTSGNKRICFPKWLAIFSKVSLTLRIWVSTFWYFLDIKELIFFKSETS